MASKSREKGGRKMDGYSSLCNFSLRYTMDHSLLPDDTNLVEQELKAMERTEEKKEKRKKKTKKQNIELVDLFLEQESQNISAMEQEGAKYHDTPIYSDSAPIESKEVTPRDDVQSREQPRNGAQSREQPRNGAQSREQPRNGTQSREHSRADSAASRKHLNVGMRSETVETELDMTEDGSIASEGEKQLSKSTESVKAVFATPLQKSQAAGILSCILMGMFVEASYPPVVYCQLFKTNLMEDMLVKMRPEERSLMIRMLEDW